MIKLTLPRNVGSDISALDDCFFPGHMTSNYEKTPEWFYSYTHHSPVPTPSSLLPILLTLHTCCTDFYSSANCNVQDTVQHRYKRTTHTRIIHAYFAYRRMSICTHTRVYVYLLCIPISFLYEALSVEQKRNLHIVKMTCRSVKAIIFRVFDYSVNSLIPFL